MSRLPRVTGKELVAALRRDDWELSHVRGSHHYLCKGSAKTTVPIHAGETLGPKLLLSILEQSGLSLDELLALLGKQ